jgi:hypothetical protein
MTSKANLPADYADFTDFPQSMLRYLRTWWLKTGDFVLFLICVNLRNLRAAVVFGLEGAK